MRLKRRSNPQHRFLKSASQINVMHAGTHRGEFVIMLEGTKLEAEIAQIERELEILRGRYGLMERWAKVTMYVAMAGMLIVFLIGMYGTLTGEYLGVAAGVVLIVFLLCVVTGWGRFRWIDLISWSPPGRIWQPRESEAAAIERMIAEREARLAALKRQAPGSPI